MDKDGNISEQEYEEFSEEMRSRIEAEGEPFLAYFAGAIGFFILAMLVVLVLQVMGVVD